ncbi:MAG TPA: DUF3300 domain-containing protein [Xanthobacteraceae bacterium]
MRRWLFASLVLIFPFTPSAAWAQTQPAPASAPSAPSGPSSPSAPSADQLLEPQQLDALVAPIALYPDDLLSLVLMASTYPLEVVQADRWAAQNKSLAGDALKSAVDKQEWDTSVKSLIATPSVLAMMSSKLDWTQKLGDAVLAQQPDVMDAIQRLRARAQANDKLKTTPQQVVSVAQQPSGQPMISIQSTSPDTVYVPYYDPGVVYGSWPYSDYPPYAWGYPGYIGAGAIAAGVAFGTGYLVGRWANGNWNWGGGVNWGNRNLIANRPRVNPLNVNNINTGNVWRHNPAHRQGVRYSNANVQQRFGHNQRAGAEQRMDFRGRNGQQVLNAGAGAVGGALANRAAQRPGQQPANRAANAANNRQCANTRQGAEKRAAANRPAQTSRGNTAARNNASRNNTARNNARSNVSRSNAMNVQRGNVARASAARGHASFGGARASVGIGGGGFRGGGGGGRGGGGRRSDIALKHDVIPLGRLANGLGFYRFTYNGENTPYVGVIAQEVQAVRPDAVARGSDGYLRVFYDKLGLRFETYDAWAAAGAHIPSVRAH